MKRTLLALVLAAALPLSAQAAEGPSEISYTYFEADYVAADVVGIDSMDGLALRASAGFAENWYATGSWTRVSKGDIDLGYSVPVDVDFDQMMLGVGFHMDVSDKAAFIAEAAWVRDTIEIENNSVEGSADDGFDGWRASAGFRGLLGSKFEGEAKIRYTDFEDIGGGFGGEINGTFFINKTWGITAGWAYDELGDDDFGDNEVSQWKVGVRASY